MKTRLFLSLVLIVMALVAWSVAPPAVRAQEEAYVCEGDLIVTTENSDAPLPYRMNGTGPGLPTPVQGGVGGVLTFVLPGPGTWSNLVLEVNLGTWVTSVYGWSAECAPVEEVVEVPVPGCDVLVAIPKQAVVGTFTLNSELYWAPGEAVSPMTYVEAGHSYYVAGQDASETYYKVLISCEWVWVRKDTVGPNYDAVWNGAPLPTTIVD